MYTTMGNIEDDIIKDKPKASVDDRSMKELYKQHQTRDKLVISVIDTGIGIKQEDHIKLFKLFGTSQNTQGMNSSGIGLGLVISDRIVHEFNGQIGVQSKFGKGSKFIFSILLGQDDDFVDIMQQNKPIKQKKSNTLEK